MASSSNGEGYSTLQVARAISVHRATLLRWLQTGQLKEPRHVRAAGMDIRVWSRADLERAKALKKEHGEAALKLKTSRLLKVDELRRARAKGRSRG